MDVGLTPGKSKIFSSDKDMNPVYNICNYEPCQKPIMRGDCKMVMGSDKTYYYHVKCWDKLLVEQGKRIGSEKKYVPKWGEK